MMENHQIYHPFPVPSSHGRSRGRGQGQGQGRGKGRGADGGGLHRNRQWVAPSASLSPGPGLSRGGVNGLSGGASRGRGSRDKNSNTQSSEIVRGEVVPIPGLPPAPRPEDEPFLESAEEREKFYQELVKSRELERKHYISLGLMDDPLVPKRLSDAITMVGTCHDLCPRFERYRRERENNLQSPWETLPPPNHKRIDHTRAVKMYERAAGDKTLPSDLRPPNVLSKTLDYLFHDLVGTYGFKETFSFVRDRTRSVRNDFTMQHEKGREAIECHERCARFHVVALREMRGQEGFEVFLEEQQLMNTLQSLKEFYTDPLNTPSPSFTPNQLEFRVYHRLIHIRDQKERHDDVPKEILDHPIFRLVTRFRNSVQKTSLPITKSSKLRVDEEGMRIFGELVGVLMQGGDGVQSQDGQSIKPSLVMPYLIACILQHLFGPETIDESEMEGMRKRIGVEEGVRGVVGVVDGGFGSGVTGGNDGVNGEGGDDEMQEGVEIVDDKIGGGGESMEGEEQDPEGGEEEEYYDDHEKEQARLYEDSATTSYPQPLVSAFSAPTSTSQSQPSAFSAFSTPPTTNSASTPIGGLKVTAFSNLTTASTNPFGTPAFGSFGASSTSSFETRVIRQPVPVSTSESPSASSSPSGQPQPKSNPSQLPFNPFGQFVPPSHPTTSPYRPPPFDQGLSANVASPFGVFNTDTNHSAPEVPLIFDPRGSIGEEQGPGPGLTSRGQDGVGEASRQTASEQGAGQGQGAASAFSQPSVFAQPPPKSVAKERIFSTPLTLPTSSSFSTTPFELGTDVGRTLDPPADSSVPRSGPDLEKGTRSLADAPLLASISRSTFNPLFSSSSSSSSETATKPPPPTLSIPAFTPSPSQSNQSGIGHAFPPPTPGAPRHVPIALPPATPTITTSFNGFNVPGRFPTSQSEPVLAPTASASAGLPALRSASTSLSAVSQPPNKRLTLLKTSNLPIPSSTSEGGAGSGILSPLQLNSPSLSRMGSLKTFASSSGLGSLGSLSGVSASPNHSPLVNGLRSGTGIQPQGVNGNTSRQGKVKQTSFSATTDEFEITDDDKEDGGSQTEPEDGTQGNDRGENGAHRDVKVEDESQKSERLYKEAVTRGEMYHSRLQRQFKDGKGKEREREVDEYDDEDEEEFSGSEASYSTGKKRPRVGHTHSPSPYQRLSLNGTTTHAYTLSRSSDVIRKPRQRPRLSGGIGRGVGVRTDEELVRRLSENQASHRHRWAPGSFLTVWREFILRGPGRGTSAATMLTASMSFPSSSTSTNTTPSASLFPSSQVFSFPSSNPSSNSNPTFFSSSRSLDKSPSAFVVHTPMSLPSNLASGISLASSALSLPQGLQKSYTLWLSLNPSSDATAIWMQIKFGVPESGWWRNSQQGDDGTGKKEESGAGEDGIFEVPLLAPSTPSVLGSEWSADTYPRGGPGIIVFECTPLNGVDDMLERKYHILDDCTRLRGLLDTLRSASSSNTRFFIPSLVFIHWVEADGNDEEKGVSTDLIDMANRVISPRSQSQSRVQHQDPLLTSYTTLSIASNAEDLDTKFKQALNELRDKDMDIEGRLVEVLELGDVFKLFHPTFDAFVSEWSESCESSSASPALAKVVGRGYGRSRAFGFGRGRNFDGFELFNAPLYAQVLQVSLGLINLALELIGELLSPPSTSTTHTNQKYGAGSSLLPLSDFPVTEVDDLESLYTTSIRWLVQMITEETPSSFPTITSQTQTTTNSIIESIVVDLQGHESMNKGFPTKRFIEQLWDLVKFDMELQSACDLPNRTQTNFIIPTSLIESAEETYADAIKPHQVSLSHSLNIHLRKGVELKHKRRSMNDIDDFETESNTSSKRLRLSPGGASSISTSRSASAMDSFALDLDHGTDSRSLFSVSVNDTPTKSRSQTSPTPTPSPNDILISNGVGAEVNRRTGNIIALANGNGNRNGMRVSSEASDSNPAVVTLEMLKALTKSMKKKYRD